MEKQNELKVLGFLGIFVETFKLIFSNKKTFIQITLSLLIPLSLIFQANIHTIKLLSSNFFDNKDTFQPTNFNTYKYSNLIFSNLKSLKTVAYWVSIQFSNYFFTLMFSLLCTPIVVFTVSCIYTGKDINLKKAFGVVPKVWKRVFVTSLLSFVIVFVYDFVLGAMLVLTLWFIFEGISIIIAVFILILFVVGSVYISMIWHLAIVVSVLEENVNGIKAITKSKVLVKGKIEVALGMLIILSVCSAGIDAIFQNFALRKLRIQNLITRFGIGIVCFFLQLLFIILGPVVEAVFYFVCKAYHNEHLEINTKTNAALDAPQDKATDVQEQLPV